VGRALALAGWSLGQSLCWKLCCVSCLASLLSYSLGLFVLVTASRDVVGAIESPCVESVAALLSVFSFALPVLPLPPGTWHDTNVVVKVQDHQLVDEE
jgi:hypothetical protein